MLGHASRLLLLAPALTYGLGAAFVAAAYGLGASPADPAAWRAFLTLAPIIREPVYFVSGLHGIGDAATFALFAMLALAGGALVLSSGKDRANALHLRAPRLPDAVLFHGPLRRIHGRLSGNLRGHGFRARLDFRFLQLSDDGRCATRLCGARLRFQPFPGAAPDEVACCSKARRRRPASPLSRRIRLRTGLLPRT